ncbi:MAG: T9SS type A sorting domain-containing protein [Bacteroidota bacterium]
MKQTLTRKLSMPQKWLKTTLLLCVVIATQFAYGQSPTNPIIVTPSTTGFVYQTYNFNQSNEIWFKTTATTNHLFYSFLFPSNIVDIDNIKFYNGNTSNLFKTVTCKDSIIIKLDSNININDNIYICCTRKNVSSSAFQLSIFGANLWDGSIKSCDLVYNGDFNSYLDFTTELYWPYSPFYYDRIGSWQTALGTPQMQPGNSNFGVYMWTWKKSNSDQGEGVQQKLREKTKKLCSYTLSFDYKVTKTDVNLDIWLTNQLTWLGVAAWWVNSPGYWTGWGQDYCPFSGGPCLDVSGQKITIQPTSAGSFQHYSGTVTSNDDYSRICILPRQIANQAAQTGITIDNISLVPISDEIIPIAPASICSGATQLISAENNVCASYNSYIWNTGENTQAISISPKENTTYTVTATDAIGCSDSEVIAISITNPPTFSITTNNNTSCETTILTINPYNANYNYTWQFECSNGAIFGPYPATENTNIIWGNIGTNEDGVIRVIASNNGCTAEKTINMYQCCSKPNMTMLNNATLTSTTPYTGNYVVNGVLTINGNVTFNIANIYFGKNAKIVVNSYKTLTITRCNLQACSAYMWDGIYVSNATSTLNIIGGTCIYDAKNAIVSANGGKLSVINTTFDRNYYSMTVKDNSANFGTFIVKQNTFKCSNAALMKLPYQNQRSKVGIYFSNIKYAFVGDSVTSTQFNTFDNLDCGIASLNSYIRVYNNKFQNMLFVNPVTYPNELNISGVSIYVLGNVGTTSPSRTIIGGTNSSTSFKKNYFDECENAIAVGGGKELRILENSFSLQNASRRGTAITAMQTSGTPVVIQQNTINGYVKGIDLTTCNNATVKWNPITVRESDNQYPSLYSKGIIVSSSTNTMIYGNTVVYGASQSYLNTRNEGISMSLSSTAKLSCNSMENCGVSIRCSGSMPSSSLILNKMNNSTLGLMLDNSCVIGPQGDASNTYDNQWNDNLGVMQAHTFAYNSDGLQSKIYYRKNATGLPYRPLLNLGYNDVGNPTPIITIMSTQLSTFFMCALAPVPMGAMAANQNTSLLSGTIAFPEYNVESKAISKAAVYEGLKTGTLSASNANISTFETATTNKNVKEAYQVKEKIKAGNYNAAQVQNNSIVPSNKPELASKNINAILIGAMQNNIIVNSQSDKQTLIDLAMQCPFEYGAAVYEARALLFANGDATTYQNPCEAVEFNSQLKTMNKGINIAPIQQEAEAAFAVNIYPNPASDILNIDFDERPSEEITVIIFDINAKEVMQQSLGSSENSNILDISGLTSGMYHICIRSNSAILYSNRINISK